MYIYISIDLASTIHELDESTEPVLNIMQELRKSVSTT